MCFFSCQISLLKKISPLSNNCIHFVSRNILITTFIRLFYEEIMGNKIKNYFRLFFSFFLSFPFPFPAFILYLLHYYTPLIMMIVYYEIRTVISCLIIEFCYFPSGIFIIFKISIIPTIHFFNHFFVFCRRKKDYSEIAGRMGP